jgi:hypothetical protein
MRRYTLHAAVLSVALALVVFAVAPVRAAGVLDQLQARFNDDKGALRLVVLVSPTCPECTGGVEWIQEYVLKRNPKLDVKVYAIWYEMYPGDSPDDLAEARKLLPDKRAVHYWDQPKDVGRWFYGLVPTNTRGTIEWDAFYLYDRDSVWTARPTELLTWGRTILKDRRKLTAQLAQLAGAAPAGRESQAVPALPTGDQRWR